MSRESDLLLGKLAIERGWITYDQLNACIQQQEREMLEGDPEATVGRRMGARPLGVIMTSKGLLNDQQLLDLYDEQHKRIDALRAFRLIEKSEKMLGHLLIEQNKATQNQINKCLEVQRKRAEQGVSPVPRLGEILVEHGFVTEETIREVLGGQNKTIMFCAGCNMTYNVVGVKGGKQYRCRKCGGVLMSKEYLDQLKVDETALGQDIADATPKPESDEP
jgi:hypothetical protein